MKPPNARPGTASGRTAPTGRTSAPPDRRGRRHLLLAAGLAGIATVPLLIGAGTAHPLLLVLLGMLSFALNLNVVESALIDLGSSRDRPRLHDRDFRDGIPAAEQTCVLYPVLFHGRAELERFLPNLERSMADNPDPNLRWAVVSASPAAAARLEVASLRGLRRRRWDRRLCYLHRDPALGNWEKKRGSYMHFMAWLLAGCPESGRLEPAPRFPAMPGGRVFDLIVGDPERLRGVANLLIGDSDTVWPSGSATRLVERLSHPGNRRFTIFQGRLAPRNDDDSVFSNLQARLYRLSRATHAARWAALGRVSFAGHGAGWNVRRFMDGIAGKMEDGYLSHDIVESYFLRTAFVDEVETTEEVPSTVPDIVRQWRRWWTGNRIAATRLLGPWRRDEAGRRVRNRNLAGKLLLLDACRYYVMPLVLAAYVAVTAALALTGHLTLLFTSVGGVYLGLILVRFYLPSVARIDGSGSACRIALSLLFLTALVQALMIEKAKIVLADAGRLLGDRARGRTAAPAWVVQGSTPADRSVGGALRASWTHSVGALSLILLLQPAAPLARVVLAMVAATPLLFWIAARRPPRWLRLDGAVGCPPAPPVAAGVPGARSTPASRRRAPARRTAARSAPRVRLRRPGVGLLASAQRAPPVH